MELEYWKRVTAKALSGIEDHQPDKPMKLYDWLDELNLRVKEEHKRALDVETILRIMP